MMPLVQIAGRGRPKDGPRPLAASAPGVPQVHLFDTVDGSHILVVNGTRIYRIEGGILARLRHALDEADSDRVERILAEASLDSPANVDEPASMAVSSLSLAVAQTCNLGCSYCYAREGDFGGAPTSMRPTVALAAVDLLFAEACPGDRVTLAFLGGEPLANRSVVREATEYAARLSQERGVHVSFSITTNGTLLTAEDGEFFERHGFGVTVSLDGIGETHDRLRPFKGGRGSFERIVSNVVPLLRAQRRMQVSARVTVTPRNLDLRTTLDALIGLGFHGVGFSPMLSSPSRLDEMSAADLEVLLDEMIACGRRFERSVAAGERYPFTNMLTALGEIHRGTHRPYPCGAGGGYFGVSADGDLFACHRFVGDEQRLMGDVTTGVRLERQRQWLVDRHVHRQEPCKGCWARYMCGGGCHHEVLGRGRPACDYIRGWLHYCLQAYVRLQAEAAGLFDEFPGA